MAIQINLQFLFLPNLTALKFGYCQYSRPEVWHGRAVPSILLSGHHANVEKWRRKQSILRTRQRRPDLYAKLDLSSKEDKKLLAELEQELSEQ